MHDKPHNVVTDVHKEYQQRMAAIDGLRQVISAALDDIYKTGEPNVPGKQDFSSEVVDLRHLLKSTAHNLRGLAERREEARAVALFNTIAPMIEPSFNKKLEEFYSTHLERSPDIQDTIFTVQAAQCFVFLIRCNLRRLE